MTAGQDDSLFEEVDGVLVPRVSVFHKNDAYDPGGFEALREMQERHFWYRGRHRFLLHNVRKALRLVAEERRQNLSAVDLGGGCGGWIAYLDARAPNLVRELALADSSMQALHDAKPVIQADRKRFQIDLLALPWIDRWDVIFLLDVLEHIADHQSVMQQLHQALRPGGLLFVTTPALDRFRTYNDDLVQHVRRYSRNDYAALAHHSRLELCWSRYFMFFLSPVLLLSRARGPDISTMSREDINALLKRTHRVPPNPLNAILTAIFALETPLGTWLPFPWGTSLLGVFRKP